MSRGSSLPLRLGEITPTILGSSLNIAAAEAAYHHHHRCAKSSLAAADRRAVLCAARAAGNGIPVLTVLLNIFQGKYGAKATKFIEDLDFSRFVGQRQVLIKYS